MESHDWRHRLLEQKWCVKQCSVTAETDDEVDAIGQIITAISKNASKRWWISSKISEVQTHLNVTNLSLTAKNLLSSISSGSSSTADSTHTTMCFSSMSHSTSWMNGESTVESRTFFMTRTASGGLYHVKRWLAGSWICITIAEFFMIRPHGPNCWKGDGAFKLRVRLKRERSEKELAFVELFSKSFGFYKTKLLILTLEQKTTTSEPVREQDALVPRKKMIGSVKWRYTGSKNLRFFGSYHDPCRFAWCESWSGCLRCHLTWFESFDLETAFSVKKLARD